MVSCVKRTLHEVLTGGSFRYWLFWEGESSSPLDSVYNASRLTRKDLWYVYFDTAGIFILYLGDYENLDCYNTYRKYKILNDSVIEIFDRKYVVKELNRDKILLYSKMPMTGCSVVDTLEAIDINDVPKEYRKYRTLPLPPKGMLIY